MTPSLTKDDLRVAIAHLDSLHFPTRPLTTGQSVRLTALVGKLHEIAKAQANAPERGRLVLSWRLPKDLIPTQNDLRGIKPWRLKKIKIALQASLTAQFPAWPDALTHGSMKRRWVRTTRFSSKEPDELACDANGFKVAIDEMVEAGVLAADDRPHLHREPHWRKAPPSATSGLVELFLFAEEQAAAPAPAFAPVEQVVHEPGLFTKMLKTGGVK